MTTQDKPWNQHLSLVRLRPRADTLYISRNRTVLTTDCDGCITRNSETGLFVNETRLLSLYRYLINGISPQRVVVSNVKQHTWLGYYFALPPDRTAGPVDAGSGQLEEVSQETLELRVSRHVTDGFHEHIDITNFTQRSTSFTLGIELDADFVDLAGTEATKKIGRTSRKWRIADKKSAELIFDFRAEHRYKHQGEQGSAHIHRGLAVRLHNADSTPSYKTSVISFRINLPPQQRWHVCVDFLPVTAHERILYACDCHSFSETNAPYDRKQKAFLDASTSFVTPGKNTLSSVVSETLDRAKEDLAALRLYDLDTAEDAWTVAAGLPVYVALFGRDTLTVSWQSAILGPEMMRGTLPAIARSQGTKINDWRDEQPGRMLHEAHTGPLSVLNYNPRLCYYGSATTSSFYAVVLGELWHWTGDKELIRHFIAPALKALEWKDKYCDRDGDGFYEYETLSTQGVANQGWKDSGDAIVYEDGSQVAAPIETCEEQSYVYAGKLFLSEVLWWLDEKDLAKRLYREAEELKKRFNDAYWMEAEGFFAMGRDSKNRQIKTISSNPGHCIATGIVDTRLVEIAAKRLMAEDIFTGWGIRTLSSMHPAYNPYSYHRGSVWPVENGSFAVGFWRYGLHREVERICRAQFEAAALFDFYRLPELFSGHQRDADHPFPALYPKANSPQAWSASAVFCFLQSMLGIYPYAPLHALFLDPHLPEWLPEITFQGIRVGRAVITIRFFRNGDGSSDYQILEKKGPLHVVRQPSPWSLTAGWAERVKDVLTSFIPAV